MKYYSASTRGFYDSDIHQPKQLPVDAVEITDQEYERLFTGQSTDSLIVPGSDGRPKLIPVTSVNTPSKKQQLAQVNEQILDLVSEGKPVPEELCKLRKELRNNQ